MHFSKSELQIIDANANRAREGLRTAEDYLRFAAGHRRWSALLQSIRAGITAQLDTLFTSYVLVAARNVSGDPGAPDPACPTIRPEREESSQKVAQRGLKRAQEALRVLEEYTRAHFPESSAQFEKYRYEAYQVEQWLLLSSDAARCIAEARVYVLLTTALCKMPLLETALAVLRGGARIIQLREKKLDTKTLVVQARRLRELCNDFKAVLICNDRVDLALATQSEGVHLGQEDLNPAAVRSIAGEKLLIGRSTHSVEQARHAVEVEHADYIAIGSMFETTTKAAHILVGLPLAEAIRDSSLPVPVFA